jgi:hypothetical protein
MPDQELINWIKSARAQGQSTQALTKILIKQGYKKNQIEEASINTNSKLQNSNSQNPTVTQQTSLIVSITLIIGLAIISLIAVLLVLAILNFLGASKMLYYVFLTLTGLVIGLFAFFVKKDLNGTETLSAILGIFPPTLSLAFFFTLLPVLQKLFQQVQQFTASGPEIGGLGDLLSIFGPNIPSPITSGILFYLSFNIFILISIIKHKKYQTLLWYFLAPGIFFLLWHSISWFTSSIITRSLA